MGWPLCIGGPKDEDINTTPPSPEQRTGQQGTGSSIAASTATSHEGTITSKTAVTATGQRPGKEEASSSGTAAIAAGQRPGKEEASSSGTAATATGQRQDKEEASNSRIAAAAAEQRSGHIGASSSSTDATAADDSQQVAVQFFTYGKLVAATQNFSSDLLLGAGRGRTSRFYVGTLVVAIKRLDWRGTQGADKFLVGVTLLRNLDHCNLVKLIGHCAHEDQMFLVYEYMPLGSLEDHLYARSPRNKPLDWLTRMKIALGTAKGLEYLHDKCNPPVIHGDLKSSNILLGKRYRPKLSEFGIEKLGHEPHQIVALKQCDIQHFGYVLFELITGKRVADNLDHLLSVRSWSFGNEEDIQKIADPDLRGQYPMRRMRLALDLTLKCLHEQAKKRPLIAYVVQSLQNLLTGSDAAPIEDYSQQAAVQVFTISELAAATGNFSRYNLFEAGISSQFYRGTLKVTNQLVAIKRLAWSAEGFSKLLAELTVLSNLDHCNLVKFIGHCSYADHMFLVYEYTALGSLEDHLYDNTPNKKLLDWITRLKIASGAAKGLEYLHDKCNPPVIHGDLKSSNILLGEGYHPKLSNFFMGNFRHARDQIFDSKAADIYGFGIVLLDLITGKRVGEDLNLITMVQSSFDNERALLKIADPDLQGRYPIGRLRLALHLASMCISKQTDNRPLIAFVVQSLHYLLT